MPSLDTDLYVRNFVSRLERVEYYTRLLLEKSGVGGGGTAESVSTVDRVIAGMGLTGGGIGTVTLNVGAGPGITVGEDGISVDLVGLADEEHGIEVQDGLFRIKIGARGQLSFDGEGGLILHNDLPGHGLKFDGAWHLVHAAGNFGDLHTNYAEYAAAETISGAWAHTADLTLRGASLLLRTAAGAGSAALGTNATGTTVRFAGQALHPIAGTTPNLGVPTIRWGSAYVGDLRAYNEDSSMHVLLRHDGAQAELVASSGNLLLSAEDVIFDPAGLEVYPDTNYQVSLGLLNRKWSALFVANLFAETLVAHETMATIGGRIVVAPSTTLEADIDNTVTTILVKHNQIAVGDELWLEGQGQFESMVVTGGPVGSGPFAYTVTRGAPAASWPAGTSVVNTGAAGDGFIDLYSINGIGAHGIGPTIVGNVRKGSGPGNWEEMWAVGNLDGLYGYGSGTFGAAFGSYAGNHITLDATNGIRFRSGTTVLGQLSGTSWTLGRTGQAHLTITPTDLTFKDNAGATVINLGSSGNLIEKPLMLGAGGGIWQGTGSFASPTQGLKLFRSGTSGVLAGYNASVEQVRIDTDGRLKAGGGNVVLDADGVTLTAGNTPINMLKTVYNGTHRVFELYTSASGSATTTQMHSRTNQAVNIPAQLLLAATTRPTADSTAGTTLSLIASTNPLIANATLKVNDSTIFVASVDQIAFHKDIFTQGLLSVATSLTYSGDLRARRAGVSYTGYIYVPLASHTSVFNASVQAAAGTATRTRAQLGIPAAARAIQARILFQCATVGQTFFAFPVDSAYGRGLGARVQTANSIAENAGIVEIAPGQPLYFRWGAAGTLWFDVAGYFI